MAIPGKNSDLYRRLRFYGFGFLLGLLAVSFIYKGRGCKMPSSAKLEELNWQKLEYTEQGTCYIKCLNLTEDEVKQVMKSGKVNYDKSEVHATPYPTYAIDGLTTSGKNLRIVISDCDTISRVISSTNLKMETVACDCP